MPEKMKQTSQTSTGKKLVYAAKANIFSSDFIISFLALLIVHGKDKDLFY